MTPTLAIRRRHPGETDVTFFQTATRFSSPHRSNDRSLNRLRALTPSRFRNAGFKIINLWRRISHAALDWPLGLCDYPSVDPEKNVVPVRLVYPDRGVRRWHWTLMKVWVVSIPFEMGCSRVHSAYGFRMPYYAKGRSAPSVD